MPDRFFDWLGYNQSSKYVVHFDLSKATESKLVEGEVSYTRLLLQVVTPHLKSKRVFSGLLFFGGVWLVYWAIGRLWVLINKWELNDKASPESHEFESSKSNNGLLIDSFLSISPNSCFNSSDGSPMLLDPCQGTSKWPHQVAFQRSW